MEEVRRVRRNYKLIWTWIILMSIGFMLSYSCIYLLHLVIHMLYIDHRRGGAIFKVDSLS